MTNEPANLPLNTENLESSVRAVEAMALAEVDREPEVNLLAEPDDGEQLIMVVPTWACIKTLTWMMAQLNRLDIVPPRGLLLIPETDLQQET